MNVPFTYKAYLINSLYEFLKLICHIPLPRLGHYCTKKEISNFRIKKCDGGRNQKNSHFRNTLNFT